MNRIINNIQFKRNLTYMLNLSFLLMKFMNGWVLLIFWVEIIMWDITCVFVGATYLKFKSSVIKFISSKI